MIRRTGESLKQLFTGALNRVTCPACDAEFLIDVPLVFRDDVTPCLIFFFPVENPRKWETAEEKMQALLASMREADGSLGVPPCRLTLTRRSFIEKISLHINGLDDRIVEYLKYQLYNHSLHKIDPISSELFYDFSGQDTEKLPFIIFDRESAQAKAGAHVPMDVYRELVDTFTSGSAVADEIGQLFPGYYVSVERLL